MAEVVDMTTDFDSDDGVSIVDVTEDSDDGRSELHVAIANLVDENERLRQQLSELKSLISALMLSNQSSNQPSNRCEICFDRQSEAAMVPCGHCAFCLPCAFRVEESDNPACPFCRTEIAAVLKLQQT